MVLLACLAMAAIPTRVHAAQEPVARQLPNGLLAQVIPFPGSGTVRIGLVFRAGAVSQTATDAGFFRLLELALFRGNASDPGEPEPAGALDALQPEGLGGGTREDRTDLWFSIAPERLDQGLDTLAALFSGDLPKSALSDPAALESAREAALDEFRSHAKDADAVYEAAVTGTLFAKAPWRFDRVGPEYLIRGADAAALDKLAAVWLVPANALLVVAGDIDPELALRQIDTTFSGWTKAPDPWLPANHKPPVLPKPGVTRPTSLVYADPGIAPGGMAFELRYRGPDTPPTVSAGSAATAGSAARSLAVTHAAAASLWARMSSDPEGRLARAVRASIPKTAKLRSLGAEYRSGRDASWLSVSASIDFGDGAAASLPDRALSLKETIRGTEMYAMKANAAYFSKTAFDAAREAMRQARAADPAAAAALVADAWVAGGASWMKERDARIATLGSKEIAAFADEYFMRNLEVIAVRVNPADYAASKKNFDLYRFGQISAANAFWWR